MNKQIDYILRIYKMKKNSILDRECDNLVRRYNALTIDVYSNHFSDDLEKLKQDILSFLSFYPEYKYRIETETSFKVVTLV